MCLVKKRIQLNHTNLKVDKILTWQARRRKRGDSELESEVMNDADNELVVFHGWPRPGS